MSAEPEEMPVTCQPQGPMRQLSPQQRRRRQSETPTAPRRRYGPDARLRFNLKDLVFGTARMLPKFRVRELIARTPYQSWEQAAYLKAENRLQLGGRPRRALELGAACRYVAAAVPGAPLASASADPVHTGKGALIWMPDLTGWAHEVISPRGAMCRGSGRAGLTPGVDGAGTVYRGGRRVASCATSGNRQTGEVSMAVPDHGELPLRDYDHLPLASVAQRIRSLTADEIEQLLAYERAHANRPAAIEVFSHRLAELAAGASPTPGRGQSGPDYPPPPHGTPPVRPQGAAPPIFPPPHGVPAQPGKPKANRHAP
jgi:hypothetical protein